MKQEKTTTITLRAVPADVYDEILRVQSQERLEKRKQFSLESAVYKIIKSTIKKDGTI